MYGGSVNVTPRLLNLVNLPCGERLRIPVCGPQMQFLPWTVPWWPSALDGLDGLGLSYSFLSKVYPRTEMQ
jgi:hypothetical protein